MKFLLSISRISAVAIVAAAMAAGAGSAQTGKKPFEPVVGQPGKDVIWVPTPIALVEKMLDLTKTGKGDRHYDLGSGDGRTVIAAAKRGANAKGIEYNPDMVALSRAAAEKAGVADRAIFVQADIFQTDFSDANVITLYLLSRLNLKLRPIILNLKPGTRVASNSFDMGDWQPDTTLRGFPDCQYCTAHYWMVPARVVGTWKLPNGELKFEQRHQMITGTAQIDGKTVLIAGRLTGPEISFTAGGAEYTGKLDGNTIEGMAGGKPFKATRG
jgi:SAM-dependent methyltransferase